MNSQEIKKYTIEVLKQGFPNKKTLDKLSTSDSTTLNFINGNGVSFIWDNTNKNLSVNANTDYETSRENKNYAVKTDNTTNNLYVNN